MPSAEHSVTIRRPIAEVFAFVADGETARQWRPGVLDVERLSGDGAGAVYRQGVKGPGGRRIAADYEVTDYERDRRLAFRTTAGPVRPTGVFLLEEADGPTKVTFSLAAELGAIKKLVMGGAVQKTMEAEVRSIEDLRTVLESSAP